LRRFARLTQQQVREEDAGALDWLDVVFWWSFPGVFVAVKCEGLPWLSPLAALVLILI
jgi:hypothetical protein